MIERTEWLKRMRLLTEELYDHLSPLYWVKFGLRADPVHNAYLQKLLHLVPPKSRILSAACGAGLHDGVLLEAGHRVLGIDQSEKVLAKAREHFPQASYENIGLQEMGFRQEFEAATCIDAMEHICPEDWPVILQRFRDALKPGGPLYLTADLGGDRVEPAYVRAKTMGLPVVPGEVADRVEEGFAFFMSYDNVLEISEEDLDQHADPAVYHFCPPIEQVRAWLREAGMEIQEESSGQWYEHFLVKNG